MSAYAIDHLVQGRPSGGPSLSTRTQPKLGNRLQHPRTGVGNELDIPATTGSAGSAGYMLS